VRLMYSKYVRATDWPRDAIHGPETQGPGMFFAADLPITARLCDGETEVAVALGMGQRWRAPMIEAFMTWQAKYLQATGGGELGHMLRLELLTP